MDVGPAASVGLEPGVVLAGKFRVERVLGRGGMGFVVAARHIQLDELVAIKLLIPEMVGNHEAVVRFEREARAAVKIRNEHVCRVSDVGTLDSGAPYIVMEYLNGRDLSEVLEARGPLPLDEAVDYVLQASEAIAEAHALGIVHRDLKPANLFLLQRPDGSACVKVLDFGISKVSGASSSKGAGDLGLTVTASLMGSPLYMSPEQLTSARDVDLTADVWGLGVILFELLTGSLPFLGETLPQVCANILASPPRSLSTMRADLPPGVESIVNACLEKDRRARIPSVLEFARRLAEFAPRRSRTSLERISGLAQLEGLRDSGLPLRPPSSQKQNSSGTGILAFGSTLFGRSSSKWWLAGAAALVFISVGGYLVLGKAASQQAEVTLGGTRTSGPVSQLSPATPRDQPIAAGPNVAPVVSAGVETMPLPPASAARTNDRGNAATNTRVRAGRPAAPASVPSENVPSQKESADWGGRL